MQPAEAHELVALAKAKGCRLQVGHSERFNPIMQMVRPHIKRPVFIEGHRQSSYSPRGTDVDVVLDLMIHDLDLVLSFNPGPVEEVRAAGVAAEVKVGVCIERSLDMVVALLAILKAVAAPQDEGYLSAALLSPHLGLTADQMLSLKQDSAGFEAAIEGLDRKSTRLNSSH